MLFTALAVALGGATCDTASSPDAGVDAPPGYRWELLDTSAYTNTNRTWTVVRARIHRPDGGRTYVQWYPSDQPGPRPAVVLTVPYQGIDWTGEELDARWASSTPNAGTRYLDVDQPDHDGVTHIGYDHPDPERAHQLAWVHLFNNASALLVYGRFYAGGSVGDDIEDMRAGMWFLAEQASVDRARIGSYGQSWGGFEALHAAAGADPRAPAAVTIAYFPPSDFAAWAAYATSRDEPLRGFFQAYLNRIHRTTGGPGGDFTGLRASDLCARTPDATLLLHDDHDSLVPVAQTQQFHATCGGDVVYWPRTGAADPVGLTHGPMTFEPTFLSADTYSLAYLHLRLAQPGQSVVWGGVSMPAVAAHLDLVHAAQLAGRDVTWAAPRLRELCDPRLYLFDLSAQPVVIRAGAEVVATAVNAEWGTSHDAATIATALGQGLPAP